MVTKNFFTFVFIAAAITACGKSEDNSKTGSSNNSATVAQNENAKYEFKREALLSLDKYVKVDRTKDRRVPYGEASDKVTTIYRNAFWSGAAVDYNVLAYDFLSEYRKEQDEFKRSDIVKANRDRLDVAYRDASQNKHFALFFNIDKTVSVGKYDPQKKGYPIYFRLDEYEAFMWNKPNEGKEQYVKSWGFQIIGAQLSGQEEKVWFIPKDEDEARKVEAVLSRLRGGSDTVSVPTTYLGHVARSDTNPSTFDPYSALLVLDGIAIHEPKSGEVIFTVSLESSHKVAQVFNSDVRRQIDRIKDGK